MENRRRFGFRDDDELIAVLVVLLLVAILAFYFIRSFGRQQPVLEVDGEAPIAVVDDSAEIDAETDTGAVDADVSADGSVGISAEGSADGSVTGAVDGETAIAATAAPILALAATNFDFYDVTFNGMGEPGTRVQVEVDGSVIGATNVNSDGSWSYASTPGEIMSGDHTVTAVADGFRNDPQTFTLGTPIAPQLAANYNNTVVAPGQYEISGFGSPNWEIAVGVANSEPIRLPTNENGEWKATVALDQPGTYELEVFAVNSDGSINPAASTGRNAIIVTADGQPPADSGTDDGAGAVAPEDTDDGSAADGEGSEGEGATDEADAGSEEAAAPEGGEGAEEAATGEDTGAEEGSTDEGASDEAGEQQPNLYQQLQATGQHGTLLAAIDATGLTQTLEDAAGSYTIFAPTDNAFGSLPGGVVDAFLADPDALRTVLVEHVVSGELPAESFISGGVASVTNLADHVLPVALENEFVRISNSYVTQPDIAASNGVIHAVDRVILPPSEFVKPVIDTRGVPIFEGNFLTVVGTGQPGSVLILTLNGVEFGSQLVGDEGTFEIAGDVSDGEYEILAYSLESTNLLRAISDPVYLTVSNQ